jgi:hypothetical protein
MKTFRAIRAGRVAVGFAFVSLILDGTAFAGLAGVGAPELDPGMATGGLTILGVGIILLVECYRARK